MELIISIQARLYVIAMFNAFRISKY